MKLVCTSLPIFGTYHSPTDNITVDLDFVNPTILPEKRDLKYYVLKKDSSEYTEARMCDFRGTLVERALEIWKTASHENFKTISYSKDALNVDGAINAINDKLEGYNIIDATLEEITNKTGYEENVFFLTGDEGLLQKYINSHLTIDKTRTISGQIILDSPAIIKDENLSLWCTPKHILNINYSPYDDEISFSSKVSFEGMDTHFIIKKGDGRLIKTLDAFSLECGNLFKEGDFAYNIGGTLKKEEPSLIEQYAFGNSIVLPRHIDVPGPETIEDLKSLVDDLVYKGFDVVSAPYSGSVFATPKNTEFLDNVFKFKE